MGNCCTSSSLTTVADSICSAAATLDVRISPEKSSTLAQSVVSTYKPALCNFIAITCVTYKHTIFTVACVACTQEQWTNWQAGANDHLIAFVSRCGRLSCNQSGLVNRSLVVFNTNT